MKKLLAVLLILASPAAAQSTPSTPIGPNFTPPLISNIVGWGANVEAAAAQPLNGATGILGLDASGVANPANLPQYATTALVKAISLDGKGAGYAIYRQGFYAAGDGGDARYYLSPSACTTPDDGAQIAPTSGTGCWRWVSALG